jgi:hypothetical protein
LYEEIRIKYFHPGMKPGLQDIRYVWLVEAEPVKLTATLYRGNLVFRFPYPENGSAMPR